MKNSVKVRRTLEDGTIYQGKSFGACVPAAGEVVFNTAMTGYPESLTDPSYRGQILCLTYPLVGNYGAPGKSEENDLYRFYESSSIHISGLIVSDYSFEYSHWNATESLDEWLKGIRSREFMELIPELSLKGFVKKEPCWENLNLQEQKQISMTRTK